VHHNTPPRHFPITLISQIKNNLGRTDLPSLAYRIEDAEIATAEGPAIVGRIEFAGEAARSVQDILGDRGGVEDRSALDEAVEWLRGVLEDRPMLKEDVLKFAKREGITIRTLERASVVLEVVSERHKNVRGRPATWKLPGYPPTITRHEGLASNQNAESSEVATPESRLSRQPVVSANNPAVMPSKGDENRPEDTSDSGVDPDVAQQSASCEREGAVATVTESGTLNLFEQHDGVTPGPHG
jgi:hypothetical protein